MAKKPMLFANRVKGKLFIGMSIMSVSNGAKTGAEENDYIHCKAIANRGNAELIAFEVFIFAPNAEEAEKMLKAKAKDERLTITLFKVVDTITGE